MNNEEITFDEWMEQVDGELDMMCGLSHQDLSDQTWRNWFDSDMCAEEAAAESLEIEGLNEGFPE